MSTALYSIFVDKVRKYTKELKISNSSDGKSNSNTSDSDYMDNITTAVTKAVDECIAEDILRDFFITRREEAIKVSVQEYTDEMFYSELASDSFDEGVQYTAELFSWLFANGRSGAA